MTPRPDIVAIPATASIDDLRKLVQEQEYSRLPVYTENLDNIAGLIVVKDLIQKTEALAGDARVTEIMRPANFVPETKRVTNLLREFQSKRFQLAIVVDEYGGTAGLVTVEDVVEELVGEIRDEYDSEAEPIVKEADDTYVFSGKVATSDMTDKLGVEIEGDGFETVGGYVLARVGRVPVGGGALHDRRPQRRDSRSGAPPDPQGPHPPPAHAGRGHGVKAGYVALVGPAERRQVHAPQSFRRPESRHRLEQAADDPPPDCRRAEHAGRANGVHRHAGHPQARAPDEPAHGGRGV